MDKYCLFTTFGIVISVCASFHVAAAETKNLLSNGDFEQIDANDSRRPSGWDLPDGLGVKWEKSGDETRGRVIKMNTTVSEQAMEKRWKELNITQWHIPKAAKNPIAATYGLSYYSAVIPVKSGRAYRISFDYKASKPGEGGKVWVRGYGQYRGEKRRRWETIVFCRVKDRKWRRFSQVFHPTRRRPEVTEMKVMLYAYWPPGEYFFDNIRIEEISQDEYESESKRSTK